MADLIKKFSEYTKEDISEAQDRDFDMWVYDITLRIQKLYDGVMVHNKPSRKSKAALDVALIEIAGALDDAERLIQSLKTKR